MSKMQVETGALIWAIISTGASGVGLILGFYYFIYSNITKANVIAETKNDLYENYGYAVYASKPEIDMSPDVTENDHRIILIAMFFIGIIIFFMFSIFLIIGVIKKHPGYVKAYYIYFVVNSVLLVLALVMLCLSSNRKGLAIRSLFGFLSFSLLILNTVHKTYVKFSKGSVMQQV